MEPGWAAREQTREPGFFYDMARNIHEQTDQPLLILLDALLFGNEQARAEVDQYVDDVDK